jgi:hypothetical protein
MKDENYLKNSTNMDQKGTNPGQTKKNPVGARFFTAVQTVLGAHPASCTMGTGSLSRG